MTVTRLGATKQYSDNWENIFGNGNSRSAAKKRTVTTAAKAGKKKSAKVKSRKPAKKSARRK
jgi:hypothetical protein